MSEWKNALPVVPQWYVLSAENDVFLWNSETPLRVSGFSSDRWRWIGSQNLKLKCFPTDILGPHLHSGRSLVAFLPSMLTPYSLLRVFTQLTTEPVLFTGLPWGCCHRSTLLPVCSICLSLFFSVGVSGIFRHFLPGNSLTLELVIRNSELLVQGLSSRHSLETSSFWHWWG